MKTEIYKRTLDTIEFPEILYKYRDWEDYYNKRFITNREVFLSSPNLFEDEFDCKIPIRYDLMNEKQATKFYKRLSDFADRDLSRKERRIKIRNYVNAKEYKKFSLNEEYSKIYFEEYFNRIGVLSLTAENKLEEMWLKYAKNHSGFCVGYNSRLLFEYLGGGGEVKYVDELPIIFPEPIMDRETIHFLQNFSKEKKWSFEKEYRTHKFWFNGASTNDRQIGLPKDVFNSIILGKNMTQENKLDISRVVKKHLGEIPILEYNDII